MSEQQHQQEAEQPRTLPDLDIGQEISVSTKFSSRTLTVDEVRGESYILTGYGTRYELSVSEMVDEPNWVMIYWDSQPEGEIVTDIEVDHAKN